METERSDAAHILIYSLIMLNTDLHNPTVQPKMTVEEFVASVRARPGRLSALSVFHSKSFLYGAVVWARRALNSQKRRFWGRAVSPRAAPRTGPGRDHRHHVPLHPGACPSSRAQILPGASSGC
jgi:hypothetical protein